MVIENVLHPVVVNKKLLVVMRVDQLPMKWIDLTRTDRCCNDGSCIVSNFEFSFADIQMNRLQFHTHLTFAATVRKEQKKMLEGFVVNVRSKFFCAGQLYVALSLVRRKAHVLILNEPQLTSRNV